MKEKKNSWVYRWGDGIYFEWFKFLIGEPDGLVNEIWKCAGNMVKTFIKQLIKEQWIVWKL